MHTNNQVRQVLMNELGLTRESVREETKRIVQETVERKVDKMLADGAMTVLVSKALIELTKSDWRNGSGFREAILAEVTKTASQWLQDHVKIEITDGA